MHSLQRVFIAGAAGAAMVVSAGAVSMAMVVLGNAAMSQNYTGNWPVTVTHSQRSNGTICLTLTDNGSLGWPHSGPASLPSGNQKLFGTFQLIDGLLVATIQEPGALVRTLGWCWPLQPTTARSARASSTRSTAGKS